LSFERGFPAGKGRREAQRAIAWWPYAPYFLAVQSNISS